MIPAWVVVTPKNIILTMHATEEEALDEADRVGGVLRVLPHDLTEKQVGILKSGGHVRYVDPVEMLDEATEVLRIGSSGDSLHVRVTHMASLLGVDRGDYVEVTLRRLE